MRSIMTSVDWMFVCCSYLAKNCIVGTLAEIQQVACALHRNNRRSLTLTTNISISNLLELTYAKGLVA
jgi:hypothetical protein